MEQSGGHSNLQACGGVTVMIHAFLTASQDIYIYIYIYIYTYSRGGQLDGPREWHLRRKVGTCHVFTGQVQRTVATLLTFSENSCRNFVPGTQWNIGPHLRVWCIPRKSLLALLAPENGSNKLSYPDTFEKKFSGAPEGWDWHVFLKSRCTLHNIPEDWTSRMSLVSMVFFHYFENIYVIIIIIIIIICHWVGPLVDPLRSHVSRSLFKGLSWFLLPGGE